VAALQRAVTGGDYDDIAVYVGEALGLHVPGAVEVVLDEALSATEGADRLAYRRVIQFGDLLHGAGHLQPTTAAAEHGFDRDRPAVLGSASDRCGGASDHGRPGAAGDSTGGGLVAQGADRVWRWADPGQAGVQDGLCEFGVLRQEAVAGVHRVGAGERGGVKHLGLVQIAGRRGVPAKGERLVGSSHVRGVTVGVGVYGDACDACVPAGPRYADGDLAAVGDQYSA